MFRGSGTQGLTAIHLKKDNYIERPLLGFTTEDVRQFIKENRFSFYQDSSNLTSDFLRNRIRNSIIPQLKEINPLLDEAMSRTTNILKEEYRYFTDRADRFLKQHLKIKKILPASPLLEEPVAMQRHILRQYIRLIKGDLLNIGYEHIEAIIDSIGTNNSLAIPGTELSTDKQFLYPSTIDIPDYSFELNREDTLLIAHAGFKITTAITDIPVKDEKNRVVTVPVSSLSLPLTVRSPLKTDKYRKAKTSFRQKIFEMIRAAGISVPLRNLCPVILTEDTPVWAYRCPVSADFYINPSDSPPYLKISIEEL